MSCDNVPTTSEIGQAKKDVNDFNTFMTSTSDTFVDSKSVSRLTLQGAINKFGFGIADFTFTTGGTLSDRKLLVSNDPIDGFLYRYVGTGTGSIVVTAGTDPTIGTDWESFTATSAEFISNANGGSVQDFIDAQTFANVESMLAFDGLIVGQRYSTGGTTWKYLGGTGITAFKPVTDLHMTDWGVVGNGNESATAQQSIDDVGSIGGGTLILPAGTVILSSLIVRHENIHIKANDAGTLVLNPDDFTTGHQPTIWLSKSNCSVKGVKFSYVGWDSVDLASLLTARPSVSSYYGNHVAVNFTELYTAANSGIPLVFRGEALDVVRNIEISGCEVIGAALHCFAAFNTVGIKVNNNKIREFKGTGFLAFICGDIEFNQNNLESSKDDGVYLSNYSTHLGGVWTPLTQNDMINVRINSNVMDKIGAKYIGVSGYINVMIDGNYLIECRSSPILVGTESSTNGTGCGDVIITNNVIKDAFGAFGLPSDGYGYSSDIVSSVGGTYHVFDVIDTNNINISSNIVKISPKVVSNSYRAGRFEVCDTVSFCANTLYDIITYGLIFGAYGNVLAASNKCFVTGNTFRHRDAVSGMRMVVSADGSQVNIRLNSFYSNDSYSNTWAFIDTSNPNYTGISNNTFYNPNGASEIRTLDGIGSNIQISDNQSTARTQGRELNNNLNSVTWGTAVPTGGYYSQGDIIFNKNAVAGGFCGWVCISTGAPGAWKTFGAISA